MLNPSRRDLLLLALLAAALVLLRAGLNQLGDFQLHFDEAQYWEWSQQLDWSYYSKGPLVAWLIALSSALLGHSEAAVRIGAWLAYSAWITLLFLFSYQFWQSRAAGWWAVALGLSIPLYFPLGQVMTTDIFLFLLWTWGLWAAWRALYGEQPRAWYEFAIAIGLGGLTKASMALLPLCVGASVLLTARGRQQLRSRQLWQGLLIAALLVSPVLLWNAHHDWVMLRHERGHVLGLEADSSWLAQAQDFIEFVAGQLLALWLLPLSLILGWSAWRTPEQAAQRWLWGITLAIVGFFTFKALSSKVQLNWPAPAYLSLLVLWAGYLAHASARQQRWAALSLGISALLIAAALFPSVLGVGGKKAPFSELQGWRTPIAQLAQQSGPVEFLLVPSYHLAGRLAFYWPQRLAVYPVAANRRTSQHDLWPSIERENGHNALYMATRNALPEHVQHAFRDCQALTPVPSNDASGKTIRTLYGWRCTGFQLPSDWPKPSTY